MNRSDFPAWRLPFPTLPTVTGRRRASRLAKKQHAKEVERARRFEWHAEVTRSTMANHRRIMALGPLAGEPDNA